MYIYRYMTSPPTACSSARCTAGPQPTDLPIYIHLYIYIYIHTHTCINIYIYRERERDREREISYIEREWLKIYIYRERERYIIYIYIYVERERDVDIDIWYRYMYRYSYRRACPSQWCSSPASAAPPVRGFEMLYHTKLSYYTITIYYIITLYRYIWLWSACLKYGQKCYFSWYVAITAVIDPCLLSTVLHFECFRVWLTLRVQSDCQRCIQKRLIGNLPNGNFSAVLWKPLSLNHTYLVSFPISM